MITMAGTLPSRVVPLTTVSPGMSELPSVTPEQSLVAQYKGSKLVVKAYAGTGKTFVLIKYSLNNPRARILYIAFNRAIRDEAHRKFPSNVTCKTSHQLAYAAVGRHYRHKLSPDIRLRDIAQAIQSNDWGFIKSVKAAINNFMASSDIRFLDTHVHGNKKTKKVQPSVRELIYGEEVLEAAKAIWERMVDIEDEFPITHDGYLKLYQISMPSLDRRYDIILFDEAQDTNPVTNHIIVQQKCKIIYVGDSHQQIYRFRGADDALQSSFMRDADILHLTHSFRFGPQIAAVANMLLMIKKEKKPVVGRRPYDQVLDALPRKVEKYTLLSRTVISVIGNAISAALANRKIFWVGGIGAFQLSYIEDLYWFAAGEEQRVQDRSLLQDYSCFEEYERIAKATRDTTMLRAIKLIEEYQSLPSLLALVRKQTTRHEEEAYITISTAHRCKGLEWPVVMLANDFPDVLDPDLDDDAKIDEINLLYVACTRAVEVLILNDAVSMVLAHARQLIASKQQPLVGDPALNTP